MKKSKAIVPAGAVILLFAVFRLTGLMPEDGDISNTPPVTASGNQQPAAAGTTQDAPLETARLTTAAAENGDDAIAALFENGESDVQVTGAGSVVRVLADDNDGGRHQRFILELESGQTLLIAHNIDIAPRLDGLSEGDEVSFYGEYYYSEQGGGVHWTHRDPDGGHIDGWLKWDGKTYD
ncbi:MAG: DUF3465 domain-containing protein [Clostridiales bacterium]|jgi:hypothetical protein|nr:DUF3465 domain-containing protein [Clostridiales bacterium]